jgi:hypothetical protein
VTARTPQSVRDALADAETLRRVNNRHWRTAVEFEDQCSLRGLRFRGLFTITEGFVRLTEAGAARAAFRAVPGLR